VGIEFLKQHRERIPGPKYFPPLSPIWEHTLCQAVSAVLSYFKRGSSDRGKNPVNEIFPTTFTFLSPGDYTELF